jgi:anti-sigma factor RsiW
VKELRCDEFVEQTTDFLDGALCAEAEARFRHHLAICPGCAPYLDQIRRTIKALADLSVGTELAEGSCDR